MRLALLIALGLLSAAAAVGAGAKLIGDDSAGPPQSPSPHLAKPQPSSPSKAGKASPAGERTSSRTRVTAPYDHRSREGIEEAEVDSHKDGRRPDG
jgi:hypothetical protein